MSQIKIKNFGPIKDGYQENEGWMDIKKVTVFIGNQGSGKSTVTKLISTLMWIEKSIIRKNVDEKKISANWFIKQCIYQNIGGYFKENTIITYKGEACTIHYEKDLVSVINLQNTKYKVPKIMYVPSERNFVSSFRNINTLKGLPSTLYTFSDEFLHATEDLKGQIDLPINNAKFEYQKLNKLSWIVGEDYKIKLSESSSGFQSFVPMYLVTRHLAMGIITQNEEATTPFSIEDERKLKQAVLEILSNTNLSEDLKKTALEFLSNKFTNSCFINIVEEPEQNLFPSSQKAVLYSLLAYNNLIEENRLIMTTHSPYIVNYLSLVIQGSALQESIQFSPQSNELLVKLQEIVPITSLVSGDNVVIYQLDERIGSISQLPEYEGIPSDKNFLNMMLREGNQLFDSLLEIEEQL